MLHPDIDDHAVFLPDCLRSAIAKGATAPKECLSSAASSSVRERTAPT